MPQKPKTEETAQNPVVAEAPGLDRTSGRRSRPAPESSQTKRKAAPRLKSRSSRGSASPAAGSQAATTGHPAPMSMEAGSARKSGAKKTKAAGAVPGGRSLSARTRSGSKPARAAGVVPQPEGGELHHAEDKSRVDGNGHFDQDEIARLAYSYWEARSYQGGSPEEDWFRAQAELRQRSQQSEDTKPGKRTRRA